MRLVPALLLPFALGTCVRGGPLGANRQLLHGLAVSPTNVRMVGERTYEVFEEGRTLKVRERFVSDGSGRFRLELLAIDGRTEEEWRGSGQEAEWESRAARYRDRPQALVLHRDFRVEDPTAFVENWKVTIEGPAQALGRPATALRVEKPGRDGGYRVLVDAVSRVALEVEERGAGGQPLARTRYVTIEFPAEVPDGAWHEISAAGDATGDEILEPLLPRLLPPGYVHAQTTYATFVAASVGVARIDRYTDGLENLFLLQYDPQAVRQTVEEAAPEGPVTVRRLKAGTLEILDAILDGRGVLLVGKIPTQEALDLLGSLAN